MPRTREVERFLVNPENVFVGPVGGNETLRILVLISYLALWRVVIRACAVTRRMILLSDLEVEARVCDEMGSSRQRFPVMITETAYGDHLGIAYEGHPKTTCGDPCPPGGPCELHLTSGNSHRERVSTPGWPQR
jgi:hypothetical protein